MIKLKGSMLISTLTGLTILSISAYLSTKAIEKSFRNKPMIKAYSEIEGEQNKIIKHRFYRVTGFDEFKTDTINSTIVFN